MVPRGPGWDRVVVGGVDPSTFGVYTTAARRGRRGGDR